jgi:hypothetical protein
MKKMKKKMIAGVLLGLGLSLQAQVIDLSTGMQNGNGLPVWIQDDTWSVKVPGSNSFAPVHVSTGCLRISAFAVNCTTYASNSCARWISPHLITSAWPASQYGSISSNASEGVYEYKMSFDRSTRCARSATLNLNLVAADNLIQAVVINGYTHDLTSLGIDFSPLSTVTLNIPGNEILPGNNTIVIKVLNNDLWTGLFICGNIDIDESSILQPSVSGNTNFCGLNGLTFVGDDGAGDATNHLWKVVETNASGVPVGGSTEWQSPTFTGSPGTYTIPALSNGGPNLQCGKYYRIQLAVTNACYNWLYAEKIIKINCVPNIVLGHMDNTICKGYPLYLSATANNISNYTVEWKPISPAGAVIYHGPPASVITYPQVNTTYQCTITDNLTGCSATATYSVSVFTNQSSFNLLVNQSDPSFATVQLTANDLLGFNNPGFYYALSIEELNTPGGTPYYSLNPNNACWWNYPGVETFKGFISTGTGTYIAPTVGTCTNPGRFLYGHTYRITRGTWNAHCPYLQSSVTMIPVRAANGNSFIVVEDNNAPDLRDVMNTQTTSINNQEAIDLIIYPNPSNGLFTIQMNDEVNMTIEVLDILGQKIKSMSVSGNNITLDLTEFSKGMYLVNILQGSNKITKRVIVE